MGGAATCLQRVLPTVMPPRRRPAAAGERVGALRRPAAAGAREGDGWERAGEVSSDTLLGWQWVHLRGRYWDEEVEVIGKVMDIKRKDTGREILLKASGTPSESLLRALSGVPSRQLRVHLCPDPCPALVWEEAYLHCSQVREVERGSLGWSQTLEAAVEKEDDDEVASHHDEVSPDTEVARDPEGAGLRKVPPKPSARKPLPRRPRTPSRSPPGYRGHRQDGPKKWKGVKHIIRGQTLGYSSKGRPPKGKGKGKWHRR